jgi:hypothetical protein
MSLLAGAATPSYYTQTGTYLCQSEVGHYDVMYFAYSLQQVEKNQALLKIKSFKSSINFICYPV